MDILLKSPDGLPYYRLSSKLENDTQGLYELFEFGTGVAEQFLLPRTEDLIEKIFQIRQARSDAINNRVELVNVKVLDFIDDLDDGSCCITLKPTVIYKNKTIELDSQSHAFEITMPGFKIKDSTIEEDKNLLYQIPSSVFIHHIKQLHFKNKKEFQNEIRNQIILPL